MHVSKGVIPERGRLVISSNGRKNGKKGSNARRLPLRSAEMREITQRLASLGLVRMNKGEPLNVRRRESVRRALSEAGTRLGWDELVALDENAVDIVAKDVTKMLRSGVRLLERGVADEMAEKKKEVSRLEKVVESVHGLVEDPEVGYPTDITYSRTFRSPSDGFVTKAETVTVSDSKEALRAVQKLEKSLPRWTKLREEMLEDLRQRQKNLGQLSRDLSLVVESWRGLLKEVLVTMP